MKLWGGRFEGKTGGKFAAFNSSLSSDFRLYPYDIQGSRVHVKMLSRQGIIKEDECEKILEGLDCVAQRLDEIAEDDVGASRLPSGAEDIHSLVEGMLQEEIGDLAGKMHTARSRNDQVALDMKLYMKDQISISAELITDLMEQILDLAGEHVEAIMPGFTHLQPAQPVTLAHLLLAHCQQLKRDHGRLKDLKERMNTSPLGSGALAGTTFAVDREWTAEKLGFAGPAQNSMDAVSDRDYLLEFHNAAVIIMTHLSSLAEEMVIWNSQEFDFMEISDSAATGSSIMPQKKNPDIPELIRGKSGRMLGNYTQLAHVLKSLPLAYNKDLQEDKENVFAVVDTLQEVLIIQAEFMDEIDFNLDKMAGAAEKGYVNATELADYLARLGLPFRRAHQVVGEIVNHALESQLKLQDISADEWRELLPLPAEEIDLEELYENLKIERAVERRDHTGGPAPAEAERQISDLRKWLGRQTESREGI